MTTSWQGQASVDDSRRAGRELFDAFRSGAQPTPVATSLSVQYSEFCVGEVPVTVVQWATGDGNYVHKSGGYWGGGLVGLVALRSANAIGNARRRGRAEREAQGRWEQVDTGLLILTNKRFAIRGSQPVDMWFQYIQSVDCDGLALQVQVQGWSPMRLTIPRPDYWHVMFNKVAYDRLILPPQPSDGMTESSATSGAT